MDALPPARSWADHSPSYSSLTAASAILSTPGTMASKTVNGAGMGDTGSPESFLRWPTGPPSFSIMQHHSGAQRRALCARAHGVRLCMSTHRQARHLP